MRKRTVSIVCIALHALLFTALFLPPVFLPDHGNGNGWEYYRWLMLTLWPLSCFAAGIALAAVPRLPLWARLLAPGLIVPIGGICLCFSEVCAPWAVLLYGAICAIGYSAMRLMLRICRTLIADYRLYKARREQK